MSSPETGDELSWSYDELDRVSRMHDSSGSPTDYTYTANDLVESIVREDGRAIRYQYDANDRLERIEDHEGEGTDYRYNERDEVTSVTSDDRTVAYGYDLVGRLVRTTLPNGIECARSFDERNRLVFLNYQKGSSPLLTYKYAHNQFGQRIVEEKISADQCKLSRFEYNPRRELIASDRRVNGGCRTLTRYGYDLNHNRIRQNQTVYQHNAADQLTDFESAPVNYNAQGQATSFKDFTFSYNQDQQIKEANNGVVQASYEYDGSGRRVGKVVNGTRTDYLLLGHEVLKTYEDGQRKAKYFLGLSGSDAFQHLK